MILDLCSIQSYDDQSQVKLHPPLFGHVINFGSAASGVSASWRLFDDRFLFTAGTINGDALRPIPTTDVNGAIDVVVRVFGVVIRAVADVVAVRVFFRVATTQTTSPIIVGFAGTKFAAIRRSRVCASASTMLVTAAASHGTCAVVMEISLMF